MFYFLGDLKFLLLSRTKFNKMKGADNKEIDPLTLIHVMAK